MLRMTNDQSEWPGTMKIMICRPIDAVKSCASRLSVSTISKKTSIISLSYTDVSKRRAELFLSRLIEIYNRDAMEDKNKVTGTAYIAARSAKCSGDRWRILLLPKSPKRTVRRQMPLI